MRKLLLSIRIHTTKVTQQAARKRFQSRSSDHIQAFQLLYMRSRKDQTVAQTSPRPEADSDAFWGV